MSSSVLEGIFRKINFFFSACRMVGHIGLKCMEYIPEIVPVLITVLKDEIPAVARQAIRCGIDMFTWTLFKVAVQVSTKSSWTTGTLICCTFCLR